MRALLLSLVLLASLVGAGPVLAQAPRIGGAPPDPIEQSRALSLRALPALPPPAPPAERMVPERRVRIPETGQEVVIPAHAERRISDQQVSVPPLAGFPTGGGAGVVHFPGGERPPADLRQGP